MLQKIIIALVAAVVNLSVACAADINQAPQLQLVVAKDSPLWTNREQLIKDATTLGVNFAGKYTISVWPCGNWYQCGAVIDHVTGKVAELPSAASFEFRPDKGILITNPDLSELTDAAGNIHPLAFRGFYKIDKDGQLKFVRKDKTEEGTPSNEQVFAAYPSLPILDAWVDPCIAARVCD